MKLEGVKMIERLMGKFQEQELLHLNLYREFAKNGKNVENREVLETLAKIEEEHYSELEEFTGRKIIFNRGKMNRLIFVSRILGIRFILKYLEKKEDVLKDRILELHKEGDNLLPNVFTVGNRENELMDKLYDEKLLYVSAIVLGLNDALVELSGALAGYTLAIENTKAIGVIGLITGIAAALSMGIAEYLSIKEDPEAKLNYNKAAIYTGITYIFAVILLVFPYFLSLNKHLSLAMMVGIDILLVFIFNYYISITTDANLMKKFLRMTAIVLSVAAISFIVGYFVQDIFGVKV